MTGMPEPRFALSRSPLHPRIDLRSARLIE